MQSPYQHYLGTFSQTVETKSFRETFLDYRWVVATSDEIVVLKSNHTKDIVYLPLQMKLLVLSYILD